MTAQITALPRSGTAFLTVLMNLAPNCLAMHELFATDLNWKQTAYLLGKSYGGEARLFCDVGTYQFMPLASIPDSIKVYVRQDPDRSRERTKTAFGYDPGSYGGLSDVAERWAHQNKALIVEQSDLFTLPTLRTIWRHCNPAVTFPESKAAILLGMEIQRMNGDKVFAKDAHQGRGNELWES